jgi:hypothetical protein
MPSLHLKPASPDPNAATVVCPQCGYDLRAIPEQRCPECGYGFDQAAVRAIASEDCWQQVIRYRKMTRCSAMAAALSIPSLCAAFELPGPFLLAAILICLPAGLWFWQKFTAPGPPNAWKDVLFALVLLPVPLAFAPLLMAVPLFGNALALVFIGWAIWEVSSAKQGSPHSSRNVPPDQRSILRRDQRTAWTTFGLACAVNFVAWI